MGNLTGKLYGDNQWVLVDDFLLLQENKFWSVDAFHRM